VDNNETGILIENTKESWFEAVSALIESPEKRKNIGDTAFKYVKSRYDLPIVSYEWAGVFEKLDRMRPEHVKPLIYGGFGWRRVIRRLERYAIYTYISYKEGGFYLISKRVSRKIARKILV
jgi:hypothetical protein